MRSFLLAKFADDLGANLLETHALLEFVDPPQSSKHILSVETMPRRSSLFFGDESDHGVVVKCLAGDAGVLHDFTDLEQLVWHSRVFSRSLR